VTARVPASAVAYSVALDAVVIAPEACVESTDRLLAMFPSQTSEFDNTIDTLEVLFGGIHHAMVEGLLLDSPSADKQAIWL
jgi:hypothetical protein